MPDVCRLAVDLAGPTATNLRRLPLTAALDELWPPALLSSAILELWLAQYAA